MLPLLLACLLCAALVGLNLWATWRILRDALAFPAEKMGRLLLVWCLPIVGYLLTTHLMRNEPDITSGRYLEESDAGDAMEALQDGLPGPDNS